MFSVPQVLKKQSGLFLCATLDTTLLLQAAISCLTMPEQVGTKFDGVKNI